MTREVDRRPEASISVATARPCGRHAPDRLQSRQGFLRRRNKEVGQGQGWGLGERPPLINQFLLKRVSLCEISPRNIQPW